jgi:hypothetical protein
LSSGVLVVQSLPVDEISDDPTSSGSVAVEIHQAVASYDFGKPENNAMVATASVVIVMWIQSPVDTVWHRLFLGPKPT